ncbi:hypothetical protein [Clostridium ljungdahlii]|uniref:Uncharacterized protein n=1 Tax=Clostridium ljungdahlii TaxID=1538 RepID=A0A162KVL4_9CLOT|nr:hypothetical protein [Clostridium ljungdahlii]OAA84676.1 hypothetical protein WY13_02575 [Clostridium ljungdahlii]
MKNILDKLVSFCNRNYGVEIEYIETDIDTEYTKNFDYSGIYMHNEASKNKNSVNIIFNDVKRQVKSMFVYDINKFRYIVIKLKNDKIFDSRK